MNILVLLATAAASLTLGNYRSLLVRYFPYLPTVFDSTTTPADYYDFIVVGAGCGGSVVASRLSETSASVLLLEAGGSAPPESATTFLTIFSRFRDRFWYYRIKPQTNAFLGYVNQSGIMRLGRVMGGTSSTNGMVYNRGNKMDYDSWARLGNTGWDYESILPYLKKSEDIYAPGFRVDEKYHGKSGPLKVTRKGIVNDLIAQFLKAGRQLGYKTIDPNGPQQIGVSTAFETLRNGVRYSASESFLAPVVGRPNLQIRTNALVTRILFNRRKRAVGVQYIIDGQRRSVFARKEVILSAGVVQTPQLLMLSGVGPRGHLEEMGIPVVAAVEGVGKNLHEHPGLYLSFTLKEGVVSSALQMFSPGLLKEYIVNQTGPLAISQSGEGFAFLNVGGEIHPSWPDVWLALTSGSYASAPADLVADQIAMKQEMYQDIYASLGDKPSFQVIVQIARPKSRGSISLRSKNPAVQPIIDINQFDDPDDVKLFVQAIRKTQEIMRTPAMKDVLEVREPEKLLTPCRSHGRDTDAYWECYVRHMAFAGFHLTSSAMMAAPTNPMGVVSPRLRVRGVTGLRVVDSSVMPHNIGGNPMATIYMIGEKGADIIREDWGYFTEFIE